ncbi:hypothetical protein FACS1894111_11920 [Clostridia bacterium]|nr:hypothetical protein FACS1894111_11920 [Clostridia bacterium]
MKNTKRILALIGVALLILLYLSTLVFALLGKEFLNCLMAAVATTILLPVLIWVYGLVYRLLKGDGAEEKD